MFTLIIEDKHGSVADEYTFEDGEFLIGRSQSADIILPSDNVSRRHARLYTADGKCYIEDLGSSNGVFVNGKRIREVFQIQRSAQLKVGDYYLHIEGGADDDGERVYCQLLGQNLGFSDQVFKIQRTVTLIGRGKDCSLTLIDPSISRIHAKLTVDRQGSLVLEDLKSSNGTFANNERIEVASVGHRDVIRIGNAEFIVEIPETRSRGGGAVANYGDWEDDQRRGSGVWLVLAIVAIMLAIGAVVFAVVGLPGEEEEVKKPPVTESEAPAEESAEEKEQAEKEAKMAEKRKRDAKEIEYHISEGTKLVKKKQWDRALRSWKRVRELAPLDTSAVKAINQITTWKGHRELLDEANALEQKRNFGEAAMKVRGVLADSTSVYFEQAEVIMKRLTEMKSILLLEANPKADSANCEDLKLAARIYRDIRQIDPRDQTITDRLKKTEAKLVKSSCK